LLSGYLTSGEPITAVLIRQIHKRLVQGVRGNKASPGEYRKIQNYIVNLRTGEKTYTPPPPLEVPQMMTDFVSWLQSDNGRMRRGTEDEQKNAPARSQTVG
jgi:Fic family protein